MRAPIARARNVRRGNPVLNATEKKDPKNYGCGFWAVFDVKVNAANARLHAAYKTKPRALLAVGADTASRGERWVLLRRAKA